MYPDISLEKVKYFTSIENIEMNALEGLSYFNKNRSISSIAAFPDIHYCSEKNIPVGVAFRSSERFFPLITGKDMGCGVAYLRFDKKEWLKPFDKGKHYKAFDRESLTMTDEGLGGGNHFLSIEEGKDHIYIIVHTGSRNLGIEMYQRNIGFIQEFGNIEDNSLPFEFATRDYISDYNKILEYSKNRRFEFLIKTFKFLVKNKYVNDLVPIDYKDSCHNFLEFKEFEVIHRKGSTDLSSLESVVIPLSMSRGSLIVKANIFHPMFDDSISSCSHGAGRKLSRTDTLKYWHSLKKSIREEYKEKFSELLDKSGNFPSASLQEFDFAYKDSDSILSDQPYLIKVDETTPIVTVKFSI